MPTAPHGAAAPKITGTKAGSELNGLPPTFSGQLTAEVQN